jgi:hypothetical protein
MNSNTPLPVNSHVITLEQAENLTAFYRENRESILTQPYQGKEILPLSETFNRQAFDRLLATAGCAGIRIYYGMDPDLKLHAVLVAVNESNEDLLPGSGNQSTLSEADDPVIIEEGQRCPPICPPESVLNN